MPRVPKNPGKPGKSVHGKPVKRAKLKFWKRRLGKRSNKPEHMGTFRQMFALKWKMRQFDNLLRKIHGKSPMYYTERDVERLIATGDEVLAKYSPIMRPTDISGITMIVKEYKQEVEQNRQRRMARKNRQ